MMSTIVSGVAAVAASVCVPVVLVMVLKSVRQTTVLTDAGHLLSYGKALRLLVAFFWLCAMGFGIAAAFAPASQKGLAICVWALFVLLVLVLHLEFFFVRIVFDDVHIRTWSPWRRGREIPLAAVERVWFSPGLQWYVVQTNGYGRVRLHQYLSGVPVFLKTLETRNIDVGWAPGRREK